MTFSKDTKVPHEGEKYKRKEVVDTLVQVVVSIHGKKKFDDTILIYLFKKLLRSGIWKKSFNCCLKAVKE